MRTSKAKKRKLALASNYQEWQLLPLYRATLKRKNLSTAHLASKTEIEVMCKKYGLKYDHTAIYGGIYIRKDAMYIMHYIGRYGEGIVVLRHLSIADHDAKGPCCKIDYYIGIPKKVDDSYAY